MKALEFRRNIPRYAAAKLAGSFTPGRGSGVGPMRLVDADLPELPNQDWEIVKPRLSGICGSDLATIDGKSARYFEPLVSFPFTPGHEVVGDLQDGTRSASNRGWAVLAQILTRRTPATLQCAGRADESGWTATAPARRRGTV